MRKNERGNVLFYIFIAIALLGALTFAVTGSVRMGGSTEQVSSEKAKLFATEIIEFGNIMATSIGQLRLRGTATSALCFDDSRWGNTDYDHSGCNDDQNKIFDLDGAGVAWSQLPSEAMDSTVSPDYLAHFYGDNEVENIGTSCGAASCSDLILVIDELHESVCTKINDLLGVGTAGAAPPTDTLFGESKYTGSFSYTATIGDEVGGAALSGQKAACFRETTGADEYVFYRVLVAR